MTRSTGGWSALVLLAAMIAGDDAFAQGTTSAPPGDPAPPADGATPPPEAWFPDAAPKRAKPDVDPPGDGAYVMEPTSAPPPPPEVTPDQQVAYEEGVVEGVRDGGLVMGMLAVRPHLTWLDGDGRARPPGSMDGTTGVTAGHVGLRGHGTGVDDDFIGRADLEAFVGASTEGVEVEGKGFLSFGLATPIERIHFLFFRFGAGGTLFGNPLLDYQVADLPALELGYLHIGADGFVELAPRVAMGVVAMHAGEVSVLDPDPAPAVGGRLLAGADALWAAADYELVTGDTPLQLAYLTACYAQKFSICLDGRLATSVFEDSVPLSGGGGGLPRVTAISGGVSFGLGVAEQED